MAKKIPDETIDVLVKGFYKEAVGYGFGKVDIVRFVNQLLDLGMQDSGKLSVAALSQ